MFKKLLIATIVLIASTEITFANSKEKIVSIQDQNILNNTLISDNYSGPYIGGAFDIYNLSKSIFAGYGKKLGKNQTLYVGGEISAYVFSPKYNGIGASVIPGFFFTKHTMAYLRLGIQSGFNDKYIYGFGLQTNLWENWDIRGELVSYHANLGIVYKF